MHTRAADPIDIRDSIDQLVAVWPHAGEAADRVRELKYGRATTVVTTLAEAMADHAPAADVVCWIPASPSVAPLASKNRATPSRFAARALASTELL